MRLLLVAPDQPGISWASEIENITSGHHSTVLTGDVREERVIRATAGEVFDAIHFATHADDAGIDMGGWVMPPSQVAQIANHVRAQLVFLNVCRSLYLPQYLIDQHVPVVLSHTKKVMDMNALRLAAYFYEEVLRQNGDLHKAYERVTPRDGTLSWSSNGAYLGILEPMVRRLEVVESQSASQTRGLRRLLYAVITEAGLIGSLGAWLLTKGVEVGG